MTGVDPIIRHVRLGSGSSQPIEASMMRGARITGSGAPGTVCRLETVRLRRMTVSDQNMLSKDSPGSTVPDYLTDPVLATPS